MANVIVDIKLMPSKPDVDLKKIEAQARKILEENKAKVTKTRQEPIAFGLTALIITFLRDESLGGVEDLETKLKQIKQVQDVQTLDVTRAMG